AKHPTIRKRGGMEVMDERCGWRPSIFMPKWACRLWLRVDDERVERLQEITSAGAIAEGVGPFANSETIDCDTKDPREVFAGLWDTINGAKAPWTSNPFVWVVTFSRTEAPTP